MIAWYGILGKDNPKAKTPVVMGGKPVCGA